MKMTEEALTAGGKIVKVQRLRERLASAAEVEH